MASKKKSSTAIELGKLVLPERKALGETLTKLHRNVNPCEVSDLLLRPFYEIMGQMRRVK